MKENLPIMVKKNNIKFSLQIILLVIKTYSCHPSATHFKMSLQTLKEHPTPEVKMDMSPLSFTAYGLSYVNLIYRFFSQVLKRLQTEQNF